MYFRKIYIEKYDLQESYNNFKIILKISFVNWAPGHIITIKTEYRTTAVIEEIF